LHSWSSTLAYVTRLSLDFRSPQWCLQFACLVSFEAVDRSGGDLSFSSIVAASEDWLRCLRL
jgi:hypothetical protein